MPQKRKLFETDFDLSAKQIEIQSIDRREFRCIDFGESIQQLSLVIVPF